VRKGNAPKIPLYSRMFCTLRILQCAFGIVRQVPGEERAQRPSDTRHDAVRDAEIPTLIHFRKTCSRDELRARRGEHHLPAVTAKSSDERVSPRVVELARHVVQKQDRTYGADLLDDFDLSQLERERHRTLLPLRSDTSNRQPSKA
jgi:hypothetical protein